MRNFFVLLFIGLSFFIRAHASLAPENALEIMRELRIGFSEELQAKGIEIKLNIDASKAEPNAFAKWEVKNKLGVITITNKLLELEQLDVGSFIMIACHEMGHFLGGEPYVEAPVSVGIFHFSNKFPNMSSEGQADFFSTSVCLPRVLENEYFANLLEIDSLNEACNKLSPKCEKISGILNRTIEIYREILAFVGIETREIDVFAPVDYVTDRTLARAGEYPSLECRGDTLVRGYNSYFSTEVELRPSCWFKD